MTPIAQYFKIELADSVKKTLRAPVRENQPKLEKSGKWHLTDWSKSLYI